MTRFRLQLRSVPPPWRYMQKAIWEALEDLQLDEGIQAQDLEVRVQENNHLLNAPMRVILIWDKGVDGGRGMKGIEV